MSYGLHIFLQDTSMHYCDLTTTAVRIKFIYAAGGNNESIFYSYIDKAVTNLQEGKVYHLTVYSGEVLPTAGYVCFSGYSKVKTSLEDDIALYLPGNDHRFGRIGGGNIGFAISSDSSFTVGYE